MGAYQIEDQGEWERTSSYMRMFLALHDKGKVMDRVAEALLVIAARYRPRSEFTREATDAYWEGGADDAQARPVYMVFCLVERAIDEPVKPAAPPGGGSRVICQAIRREFPLATDGFRKVGKLEGRPNEQGDSAAAIPLRLLGAGSGLFDLE